MAGPARPFEVLVVGSRRWFGTARLLPILRRAGCRVTALGPAKSLVSQSRYVNRRIATADAGDVLLIDALRDHLKDAGRGYDWVILSEDPILCEAVQRCPVSDEWLRQALPVDPTGSAPDVITRKSEFTAAAMKSGLPLPPSAAVETAEEARVAAERIGYPVFIKPVVGSGGNGAGSAANAAQVLTIMQRARGEQLVQKFITGPIGVVEALWNRGRPIWWQTSYKLHTHPGPYGPSTCRRFFDHPDALPILEGLGRLTGFHGIGGFDFILDADGKKMWIVEMHARPTTALHLSRRAGWDMAPALAALLAGTEAPPRTTPVRDITVSLFPQDLRRAVAQSDRRALLRWFFDPRYFRDLPFGDPAILRDMIAWAWPAVSGYVFGGFRRRLGLSMSAEVTPPTPAARKSG